MIMNEYIKQHVGPESFTIANRHYEKRTGFKRHKKATFIFEVCVQWKYGSTYWVVMKDIKDSHLLKFYKYSISVDIQHGPEIPGGCPTQ